MTQESGNDEGTMFNTAAGWVLFAGVVGLGLSIVSGKIFGGDSAEMPENPGYLIEVAEEAGGAAAEMSFAEALNLASVEDGAKAFAKCQACHSIEAGGANGIGPNLNGVMGAALGSKAGFGYSSALMEKGGNWGWEEMNQWLKAPKAYINGTSMSFAGLGKIEDRAALALYLNDNGGSLTVPEFTPEAPAEEGVDGENPAIAEGETAKAEMIDEAADAMEAATASE